MNDEILLATLKRRLGELELEVIHLQAALERERQEKAELTSILNDGPKTAGNHE
ncbi:hypothetical protein [Agrobacterium tumefaciens]|uniref:hypothetical protein n=1 Tax=Agrobacterium tumefaciens TaxID=358 RepID=UPI0015747518|nr:hypothetical protein [Agrobacterium tumefaciens]